MGLYTNRKIVTCFLVLVLGILRSYGQEQTDFKRYFKLLPEPQKVDLLSGKGVSYNSLKAINTIGLKSKPVMPELLAILNSTNSSGKGVVTFAISQSAAIPSNAEGYVLEVKEEQVLIQARTEAGLFYACQTLGQLVEDSRDQKIDIPSCKITDYPDIAYRAIHLDLKHHVDSIPYYYDLVDRLSRIKVNAIIIEFEDKLAYKGAPVVGASDAISVDEFAKISRYAKKRNIEISPLIQGLGHASFILKHEKYTKLRDTVSSDWSFDPLNPKTYELQFSLYKDAIAATPNGKYLHIGGDEVGNLGYSELAKKSGMKSLELQMYWLRKVCDFAQKNNRIPIFWDDMLFKLSGLYETTYDPSIPDEKVEQIWKEKGPLLNANLALFPKNCIYMRWNYEEPGILGNRKAIQWYKKHHLKAMAATAGQTMWPMLPRMESNFEAIKVFSKITSEEKLSGILCTLWDDCSPHFETYWRGIHDFASLNWNYQEVKAEEAHTSFRHRFYGPTLDNTSFDFQDQLEKALPFWETALIAKGDRVNYPAKIDLITLPEASSPGAWSAKYAEKIAKAKEEVNRYYLTQKTLQQALRFGIRNRFSLELLNQLNELQVYPSKLLLALEEYDSLHSSGDKKVSEENLRQQVSEFQNTRKEFEEVFTRSRVLNNPTDYLLDQNHHAHLANGTKNSDWMYVYELAMIAKIKENLLK
jgi:hexosaminidase